MPPVLRTRAASMAAEDVAELALLEPKRTMSVLDAIYGQIEFPPVIRLLTDSPIVQRLRDLKQLGNSFYVYPGATHSRFEHSLGVSYLAMELYRSIVDGHREDHRDFGVPQIARMTREAVQKDMQCIGIAGLCHDLGHGPLSHMFESFVRSSATPGDKLSTWSHEEASILLLRQLWWQNAKGLEDLGFTSADLKFVELLINGLRPGMPWPQEEVNRESWARFTTEIVANKRNGLDVDKIDYIQRDSIGCLGTTTFVSMRRLFQGARVVVNNVDETSIGFPDKLDGVIEEIFLARSHLHRIVYQHRVTKIIDLMTLDALRAAGEVFTLTNGKGDKLPLRACPLHPDFYVHASDWIVSAILHGSEEKLQAARHILERIQCRQLYTTIGSYRYSENTLTAAARLKSVTGSSQEVKHKVVLDELWAEVVRRAPSLAKNLTQWSIDHKLNSIDILQAEITQSAGDMDKRRNPLEDTYFFNARQSAHYKVEPHSTCNATTSLTLQTGPVSSIVVVCRMPLTPVEREELRSSFTEVADRLGNTTLNAFSCSPPSQRGGTNSCSQPQHTVDLESDVEEKTERHSLAAKMPRISIGNLSISPALKRTRRDTVTSEGPYSVQGVSSSSGDQPVAAQIPDEQDEEEEIL